HLFPFGTAIFSFQTFPAASGACQLRLGLSDLFLDLFFVDLFRFTRCMTRVGPAIAATMTMPCAATGSATIGVPLQWGALMAAGSLTAALLATVTSVLSRACASGSSASAALILFLDGDPLAFSLLFRRGFGTGFARGRQVDLTKDLRAFQLLRFYIFDDRGYL